ncbi:MAG: hypothetical protein AAGA18_04115 [Verrucomicrobiota bacterium]
MKHLFIISYALLGLGHQLFADATYEKCVVNIQVTYQSWNQYEPWKKATPRTRSIAGVVIDNNQILTTAYYLVDATSIRALKLGQPKHYPAQLIHSDPQLNLAIVAVEDPAFYSDLEPTKLAERSINSGTALTTKWDEGVLEKAECRFIRAEVNKSTTGYFDTLEIKMKTDMTGGGWAKPVFHDNSLIGMTAFQNNKDVASIIPAELINAYLEIFETKPYPGFPSLGLSYQFNRDPALSNYLGQEDEQKGIIVRQCYPGASAYGQLQPMDIILQLDGHSIDANGNYEHPYYGRLDFRYIALEGHTTEDSIEAIVLRNKKTEKVTIALEYFSPSEPLIPWSEPNKTPYYFIAAGLVFQEFRTDFLRAWGDKWKSRIPQHLRIKQDLNKLNQTESQKKLIMLTYVFPDNSNIGYQDLKFLLVDKINHQHIDSMTDVNQAFSQPLDSYHEITFHPNQVRADIILDATTTEETTKRILQKYNIPQSMRLPGEG